MLQVRPAGDGRTLILCDHDGRPLPGQLSVAWDHGDPGAYPILTVQFAVIGDIALVAEPEVTPTGTLPEALGVWARLSPANRLRFLNAATPRPDLFPAGLKAAFARLREALERTPADD